MSLFMAFISDVIVYVEGGRFSSSRWSAVAGVWLEWSCWFSALGWWWGRRSLCEDGPQWYWIRRHAVDLRSLPPDEGCSKHGPRWNGQGEQGTSPMPSVCNFTVFCCPTEFYCLMLDAYTMTYINVIRWISLNMWQSPFLCRLVNYLYFFFL